MDLLLNDTGASEVSDTVSLAACEAVVNLPASADCAEDDPGAAALHLVEEAATRLRRSEEHSAEFESWSRKLLERAIAQLECAQERIDLLEADCEKCNALIDDANARALMAEDALKRWDDRMGAIEAQMSATEFRARSAEARASKAEEALRRIEEAIRSQILERQRSKTGLAAAA
jgi:chromosome segregation ATPase